MERPMPRWRCPKTPDPPAEGSDPACGAGVRLGVCEESQALPVPTSEHPVLTPRSGEALGHRRAASATDSTVEFRKLALQIRADGLLDRVPAYYIVKIGFTIAALAGGWAAFVLVGTSWDDLGIALFLGAVFAQLGFIGHDAGHQQVFATRRANRLLGLLVGNALIGLSFGWWVPKHSAHHSHPNEIGWDPDVGSDFFGMFRDSAALRYQGASRIIARWRAPLFVPLLFLRSAGLHVGALRHLLVRRDREAVVEGLLAFLHAGVFFTIVLLVLSPLKAVVFVVIQQSVFSLYLGMSFAPNHKGMPVIPAGTKLDFAHRQIVTSRNVSGGALLTFVLGGLNYQIEHHLFPSMPRPNLRHARDLVKAFCVTTQIDYCEMSFFDSFKMIVRHLRTRSIDDQEFKGSPLLAGHPRPLRQVAWASSLNRGRRSPGRSKLASTRPRRSVTL